LLVALLGVAFAGSRSTLAAGAEIDGVDVGGLTVNEGIRVLAARAERVERAPVTFTAGGESFRISASQLGVEADWRAAVRGAAANGDGFGPIRGFRRLHIRLFGADAESPLSFHPRALDYKLDEIAAAVDTPSVDAGLERKGLSISIVAGRSGSRLDRDAAAEAIVGALGSLERGTTIALPVIAAAPRVTRAELVQAAQRAETALSAPVRLVYGKTRWRLPRWRIAALLDLPAGGETRVAIAGPGAEKFVAQLARRIRREPADALFRVTPNGKIAVVPSKTGLRLDRPATMHALSVAAFSATERTAKLVVRVDEPQRTTGEAAGMGITGVVASYTTTYGGTPGRLHNVQLVSELIDSTLVAPGATFSFNDTTGERSADRGFQEAPVIINGELENGLGGGVCQVSTTVFNAVYDAGLRIDRRTNHQLYISHYPLGRDATVNYPDIDLVFTNDTEAWLLLRTFVGSGSLTVNLYGTPVERRVETTVAPLTKTGPVPVDKVLDPTLAQGKRKIEEIGVPPRETSVRREVYDAQGLLLYDDTWHSTYDAEPTIVRVGTKKKSKAGNGGNPKSSSADADLAEPISPGLAATTAPATQQ
jgi:vancomycin resistance protein YoaR